MQILKSTLTHKGFRRYATNTIWLMAEKILRMFIGLFVGIWVARHLGPEQFGILSFAQSFVFLFTAIATLGLDTIVVRELVKDANRRDEVLGTAFGLKLIGALIILPIIALAVQLTSNDHYTNLLVFIIASAAVFQSFNVIDFYYQSRVLSKYAALANTVSLGVSSITKICLILNDGPLIAFAVVTIIDSAVLAIGFLYYYKKSTQLQISRWTFRWATAHTLIKDSWPLALSGLVVSIYMKVDQVMIKEILGAESVGQYAAAVRLSEPWSFIPVAIANSLFPAIVNAKSACKELYHARLQKLYMLMVWIAIAIALPITLLSDWLINLLYGAEYNTAENVLTIHIWTGIFSSLLVVSGKWYITEGYTSLALFRNLSALLINIALNLALISKHGITGAAIASLISFAISGFIFDIFCERTRHQFTLKCRAFVPRIQSLINSTNPTRNQKKEQTIIL